MSAQPEPRLFTIPLEVLHRILYEAGVLSPWDVANFARSCRAAESAAFGGSHEEREFNQVQLRAIASPVAMIHKFGPGAESAFRLGLVRNLYSLTQVARSAFTLGRFFPPTPQLIRLIEKRLTRPAGIALLPLELVASSIACGRTDLVGRVALTSGRRYSRSELATKVCHLVYTWSLPDGLDALCKLGLWHNHPLFYSCCIRFERKDLLTKSLDITPTVDAAMKALKVAIQMRREDFLLECASALVRATNQAGMVYDHIRSAVRASAGWKDLVDFAVLFEEAGAPGAKTAAFLYAARLGDEPSIDRLIEYYSTSE